MGERKKAPKPHTKGKGEREIEYGSETYFWKVGKTVVNLRSPSGKRVEIPLGRFSIDVEPSEDEPYDGTETITRVTPAAVYRYIHIYHDELA